MGGGCGRGEQIFGDILGQRAKEAESDLNSATDGRAHLDRRCTVQSAVTNQERCGEMNARCGLPPMTFFTLCAVHSLECTVLKCRRFLAPSARCDLFAKFLARLFLQPTNAQCRQKTIVAVEESVSDSLGGETLWDVARFHFLGKMSLFVFGREFCKRLHGAMTSKTRRLVLGAQCNGF
ncbi:unnamed protein product [Bursaphelenchus xylophilus]|uniref:(pine wood nematode) hypothetical protein n=1 Tax=Bursaphelenchus xylophilus TaxID=6326 RepID=A0A1I7SX01_BURXY|nr:unnamed protein product [Bursaphelenchus xylophilus]CAG9100082.1 unnamed protein product [Bursaphelenchus xylophilus]